MMKEVEQKEKKDIEEKNEKEKIEIKPNHPLTFIELLENQIKSNLISFTLLLDAFIILIKILVGFFGYSGENDPPKYGDFEAQRHWMELTIYLSPDEWYTNSEHNEEKYWPLDYPPLSGYHSYILGKILNVFIPASVEFEYSHGYESINFKNVMRFFSLFSDLVVFHIGLHFFCYKIFIKNKINKNKKPLYLNYFIIQILILLNPLMIIIDHGHFQFNNVMHGFFVFAVYFLFSEKYVLAIIFLSLCVNFKQMGLYFALVFPFYVVRKLFFSEKKKNYFVSLLFIIIYGIITVLINGIIYYPWIKSHKLKDVFNRIFPVKRGIFEDKVATFWCVLNVFIKLNKKFENNFLVKLSLLFTILNCILPICAIFKANKVTKKICMQCFFIISLAFYLFSFHVHEKTIIVPFLAFLLNLPYMKKILPSFTLIGMLSLFPLLQRENQIVPYYLTNLIFYLFAKFGNKLLAKKKEKNEKKYIYFIIEIAIFIIMILYHAIEYMIPPPEKYPWFYPMINAMFCFSFFFGIFIYSNYSLFKNIYLIRKI